MINNIESIDISNATDIYLYADSGEWKAYPSNISFVDNNNLIEELKELSLAKLYDEFSVRTKNELTFRCRRHDKLLTGVLFIFRRLENKATDIKDLFDKKYVPLLLDRSLTKGGLVVVSGSVGQGKSTTCASTLTKRLEIYGGVAFCVENPIEIPLEGKHGEHGHCYQLEITDDNEFSSVIDGLLRSYPVNTTSILMLGEIREQAGAELAIRAALNGILVIITIHGDSVINTITRLLSLASENRRDEWRTMLSSGLRLVWHQKMIEDKGVLKPEIEFLRMSSSDSTSSARIRTNNIIGLQNDINSQANRLELGMPL